MKKIVSLVGARPQFIKEAIVGSEARRAGAWNHVLVHSGQHYDANMSDIFFSQLDMKAPDHFLGIGSGTHGRQTAEALVKFEQVLLEEKPDMVLVYGDTNTTVAGALAASKLKISVAHVEAGIRQKPKDMPEEINRVLTDHISARLFCCSDLAARNLAQENILKGVSVVGDVMYDLYLKMLPLCTPEGTRARFGLGKGRYVVVTLHRDFNVDRADSLGNILRGLMEAKKATGLDLFFPMHPRTRKHVAEFGFDSLLSSFRIVDPIGYLELMSLTRDCAAVVTDSGGYQKEAYFAGKRAVVVMPDTGWRELVECGWNLLSEPESNELTAAVVEASVVREHPGFLYGRGDAGARIVEALG